MDLLDSEISAEYFSVDGNKYIIMAMLYLYSKKVVASPLSIMEVLSSESARKSVDELGGLEYLTILAEQDIQLDTISIFIKKVQQSYTRLALNSIADRTKEFIMSSKSEVLNPTELISFVETQLSDLSSVSTKNSEVYKMGTNTQAVLASRAETPSQVPGLEVGWETYDKVTNGGQPGDLIIVCAPSKVGKSVTLTNWATKIAIVDRIPILYIDTEMNEREQEDRILANLTGIPHGEITSGTYMWDSVYGTSEEKLIKLKKAREELNMGEYYHIYLPHFTIEKVQALAKRFIVQFGIKALFFDYIKIPSNQGNFKSVQEYQALGFFTSGLKDLAGMLKIPVFSACQTNRDDLESESPDASSIGGSYRILQLASKLMFLTNKSEKSIARDGIANGNQQLHIKFQRNGQSDVPPINIMFYKNLLRQVEV